MALGDDVRDNCPCPNLTCPNHGDCAKCTSSHIHKGYLSYCAFHTVLPALTEVLSEDPESPTARRLKGLLQPQLDAYDKLKARHGLSQEDLDRRFAEFAKLGPT